MSTLKAQMNPANTVTVTRMVLIPVFLVVMLTDSGRGYCTFNGLVVAARADAETAAVLHRQMARLADEGQMGNLFKVLAATSPGLATPYPFGPS